MKRLSVIIIALTALCAAGCGGGGGSTTIEGPVLSINELTALVIDQFFVNGGLDDEYAARGEFSLYLRDAATGEDVACTRADEGMEELAVAGVYYGGLSIPLTEVAGNAIDSVARFQLLFVEQDSEGCPEPIDDEDDIVGSSAELTFDGLLDQQIWAGNGRGVALLRAGSDDAASIRSMAPALAEGLFVDKLFFDNGGDGREAARYYLFADRVDDGRSTYQCQVDDELMADIRFGHIVYAALGFPFDCFEGSDPGFADIPVRVGLYIQKEGGPELVGETEVTPIGEMIGERIAFTNEKGYVSFQGVVPTPFSASVVRLGDLTDLVATALTYELTPAANATVELQVTDAAGAFTIACAGADQGLIGVGAPGSYEGLDAGFVAAEGQEALFGQNGVLMRLVERTDGLACPKPMASAPTVLATSAVLTSDELGAGTIAFASGAGNVTLALDADE